MIKGVPSSCPCNNTLRHDNIIGALMVIRCLDLDIKLERIVGTAVMNTGGYTVMVDHMVMK